MIFCFDIDGTICDTDGLDYMNARPMLDRIDTIRKLKDEGHRIVIFTARGAGTGEDWYEQTVEQLADWGVPYDELRTDKPLADLYVDDRGLYSEDFEW